MVVLVVVLFASGKTFGSTGVVTLNQAWFDRVAPGATGPGPREAVFNDRVEAARTAAYHPPGEEDRPFRYFVVGDPASGEIRVTAVAPSSDEAFYAARVITNALVTEANTEVVEGAAVTVAPQAEGRPRSPQLLGPFALAGLAGLALALVVLAILARRPAPDEDTAPDQWSAFVTSAARPGAARAFRTVVVVSAVPLVMVSLIGVLRIWALRPTTDNRTEARLSCLKDWLDTIPEGSRVYPQPGPAAEREFFWVSHTAELAFPRLEPVIFPSEAEVFVDFVPASGPDACAGFRMVVTRP